MACSRSFHFLQATTLRNVLTCKFTINQLLQRSARVIIKRDSFFELQRGASGIAKQGRYYQVEQFLSKSGATFITKWANNYKVVQGTNQMKETGEIDFGNLLLHSPLICLATDTLPLRILEKLKFCYNQKKEEITPQPQTYLRDF